MAAVRTRGASTNLQAAAALLMHHLPCEDLLVPFSQPERRPLLSKTCAERQSGDDRFRRSCTVRCDLRSVQGCDGNAPRAWLCNKQPHLSESAPPQGA